jgi:hypothetical protein
LRGFLNTFLVELRMFLKRCEAFSSNERDFDDFRLFKNIFRKLEAFDYKCEAFIHITRLFEDLFREIQALIRNLRLFQRLRGF